MDASDPNEVMRRAQVAHRQAESALSRMFGRFGRYEDDSRAGRLLEVALAREQETWIAAFGSAELRALVVQADARDETGRLAYPWLKASRAVERQLITEWQREPAWVGARAPGQEWSIVPQTYDRRPNRFVAYVQQKALARATAAADVAWRKREQARFSSLRPTWRTRWKQRLDGDLHEKLRAALAREWNIWVAVHGSHELKRLPSFHPREGEWCADRPENALRGMRQLGSEWLAKEYPGWQFIDGYRKDGHKPTLGTDHSLWSIDPSHQRSLEDALGDALRAPMSEAKRADPTAALAVFREAEQARDRGPYVFAAVVERRLPGSWVKEPVRLIFAPELQRELNAALRSREHSPTTPTEPEKRGQRDVAHDKREARISEQKATLSGNKPKSDTDLHLMSTKEAQMDDLQQERAEQLEALARQYHKPVLPVPQGASVEGKVVAILAGDHAERARAVVENERAVHVIGVRLDAAREVIGERVIVDNVQGRLVMTTRESRAIRQFAELQNTLEGAAVKAKREASVATSAERAQLARGAEIAYRDVIARLPRLLARAEERGSLQRDHGPVRSANTQDRSR